MIHDVAETMSRVPLKKDQKSKTEHGYMSSYSNLQSGDKSGKIFLFLPYCVGDLSVKCSFRMIPSLWGRESFP